MIDIDRTEMDTEEMLKPVLQRFARNMPNYVQRIDSTKIDDDPAVKRMMHDFRGVFASYGFSYVRGICERIEYEEDMTLTERQKLLVELKRVCGQIHSRYRNLIS